MARLVIDAANRLWLNPVDCIMHVWGHDFETARRFWRRVFPDDKDDNHPLWDWCQPFSRSVFFRYDKRIQVFEAIIEARSRRGPNEYHRYLNQWLEATALMHAQVQTFPSTLTRCRAFRGTPLVPFQVGAVVLMETLNDAVDEEAEEEEEEKIPLVQLGDGERRFKRKVDTLASKHGIDVSSYESMTEAMERSGAFEAMYKRRKPL